MKTGHFYFGKNRTFLNWLDIKKPDLIFFCSLLYCGVWLYTSKKQEKRGGETASTGIYKHGLHAEVSISLVKPVEINIVADDYDYAVAA